jgi:hypothetical protein
MTDSSGCQPPVDMQDLERLGELGTQLENLIAAHNASTDVAERAHIRATAEAVPPDLGERLTTTRARYGVEPPARKRTEADMLLINAHWRFNELNEAQAASTRVPEYDNDRTTEP